MKTARRLPPRRDRDSVPAQRSTWSPRELAWRVWFGTGTVVGLIVAADVGYEFTVSRLRGVLYLLAVIVAGGIIGLVLNRWETLTQRGRARTRDEAHVVPPDQERAARETRPPTATSPTPPPPLDPGAAGRPVAPGLPAGGHAWPTRARVVWAGALAGSVLGALLGVGYGVGAAFALGTGWGLLSSAGAVAGLVAAARWRGWLPEGLRGFHTWQSLTAVSVVSAAALSGGVGLGLNDRPAACPVPTELRVLTSAEDFAAIQAATPAFEQYVTGTGCYAVDVTAYEAPGIQAIGSAFAAWQASASEGQGPVSDPSAGPPPDVWIPDSVNQIPSGSPVFTDLGPVGKSPLVVAVPAAQATSDMNQVQNWPSMYETIAAHGLTLAVPDPTSSEAGLVGLANLYQPPVTPDDERRIESVGIFPADSLALLCAADQVAGPGGPAKTAYLVSEAAVADYNAGGACAQTAGQLAPLYPYPYAALTFPFVAVNWPHGQSQAARAAAREFYRWLVGTGNEHLENAGVRPLGCETGGTVRPDVFIAGQLPCESPAPPSPSSSRAQQALTAFSTARIPAHVLIAVDDSGPMSPYLPQITAAIDTDLPSARFGSQDRFAIWKLPGDGGRPMSEVAGLETATAENLQLISSRVGTLTGHDHSHNYDVLASAATMLYGSSKGSSPPSNWVVLLTDGDGGSRVQSVRSVEKLFRTSPRVRLSIIAFGPPGCSPPMPALAVATGGNCYAASQSDPVHLLGQVLGQILG